MSLAAPPESALDILARANELEREADELHARAKELRGESARLRAAAERREEEESRPRRAEPPDPMMAAAALAIEDLPGRWTCVELGVLLQIRSAKRMAKIVAELVRRGLAAEITKFRPEDTQHYRSVDPEEGRVRDAGQYLGTFSLEELAYELETPVEALTFYIEKLLERGTFVYDDDGVRLSFERPGAERIITRYPKHRRPEDDRPAYSEAVARGMPIRIVDHGKRGRLGSTPGQRHRLKMKDQRYEDQQRARDERAAAQKAKAAAEAAAGGPKSRKR